MGNKNMKIELTDVNRIVVQPKQVLYTKIDLKLPNQ